MYQYKVFVSAPEALLGQAWASPTLERRLGKIYMFICMHRSYVHSGTCFNHVEVTSNSYFASSLRHSLIQKVFINYSARRDKPSASSMATAPIQWLEQYWLPYGKNASSVDAVICIATSPLTLEVTWTNLSNGHINEHVIKDCARVPPQCRHVLKSTWCVRPVCMQQP